VSANVLAAQRPPGRSIAAAEVTLIDLVDRLLGAGIVIQGDVTLAAADIDLVNVALRLVVGSVDSVGHDLRGQIAARAS
jgi:Gas vesicle protein